MRDDITHVIWVPFSIDRASKASDPEWVRNRIQLFEDYTLQSILNQSFDDDFRILLICGQRHRAITDAHNWHPKVVVAYDEGREYIATIKSEFLAQSRIDSDDLYHRNALACVHKFVQWHRDPARLTGLVFRENLYWSRLQTFIGKHVRMCSPPPFTTRIFPKKLYQDWDQYRALTYVGHGVATYKLFTPVPMDPNMVCVVKHGLNFSHVKRGQNPSYATSAQMQEFLRKGVVITNKLNEVQKILADYGVTPERVTAPLWVVYREGDYQRIV